MPFAFLNFSNLISTIKVQLQKISPVIWNLQLHLLTLSSKLPPTNFGKCDNNCRVWLKKCKKILQKKKEIEKRNDCNKKEIGLQKPMKYRLLFYKFWHTKTTIYLMYQYKYKIRSLEALFSIGFPSIWWWGKKESAEFGLFQQKLALIINRK